jgi:hypothetical protein
MGLVIGTVVNVGLGSLVRFDRISRLRECITKCVISNCIKEELENEEADVSARGHLFEAILGTKDVMLMGLVILMGICHLVMITKKGRVKREHWCCW